MADRVLCRECGQELTEEPPGQPRLPCPNCGATAREYQTSATVSIRVTGSAAGDVTVKAPPAEATATAPVPSVRLQAGPFTRTVIWSRTPDAWLVEICDADGDRVGIEIGFDAQDVFLLLDQHLLPPGSE